MSEIILLNLLVLNPHFLRAVMKSDCFLKVLSLKKPKLYAINFKGIFLVSLGFFCLNVPEAAFRALAKLFFILSKSLLVIKTSPLISISSGKSFAVILCGISFTVFRLSCN